MKTWLVALLILVLPILSLTARAADTPQVLVEAEGFADYGGWSLDTQFIHIMGSSYLLARCLSFSTGGAGFGSFSDRALRARRKSKTSSRANG